MPENKKNRWMVRAGREGKWFDLFEEKGIVGLGWSVGESVSGKDESVIRQMVRDKYPDLSEQKIGQITGMISNFVIKMQPGDGVITYSPQTREYLVGKVVGKLRYSDEWDFDYFRSVDWEKNKVPRDSLSGDVRNSLGALLTIFSVTDHWPEIETKTSEEDKEPVSDEEVDVLVSEDDFGIELEAKIRDAIEGEIKKLSPRQMEYLVAALLKAMGYNSAVTVQSGDGGYDIYASPDGLLFELPRIRAEVKHRKGKMDVNDIRRFHSSKGDARGVYVSIGGFTKEGITEARGKDIMTLTLPQLADLVVQYYDKFDMEGRMLLPMKKTYLPAIKK